MRAWRWGVAAWLVAAATASAAPVELPPGRVAPKGRPGLRHGPQATYLYVGVRASTVTGVGAAATMLQANPALAAGDAHTLAELAVQSADQQQIVEIGWTVDALVNGDVQPRLFVFHWVDGQPTCYNGCGWVQVSATHAPGMRVTPGASADYAIEHRSDGNWWLSYAGEAMGYFPGSAWGGRFTKAGLVQWFGEIAAGRPDPCSEMGTGARGASPDAARMTDLAILEPGGARIPAGSEVGTVTDPALYSLGQMTPTSFAFGGPGAAFGCCTPTTCTKEAAACGAVPDPLCGSTIPCGGCEAGQLCGADFTCAAAPITADVDSTPPEDAGGCCGAGTRTPPWFLGLLVVIRMRRGRARRATRTASTGGSSPAS